MPDPSTFSWKRGLLHAALVTVVIAGLGAILAAAGGMADPERFGEGLGRFIGFAFAGALGVSYLFQTGRRRLAWAISVGVPVVIAAVVAAALMARPRRPPPLSPEERAPMILETIGGRRWLVHPALRVGLADPGPGFEDAPAALLAAAFKDDAETRSYGWFNAEKREVLLVIVMATPMGRGENLKSLVAGVKDGLGRSLGPALGGGELAVVDESFSDEGGDRARSHLASAKAHLHIEAWRGIFGGADRTVVVIGASTEGDGLAAPVASLRRL